MRVGPVPLSFYFFRRPWLPLLFLPALIAPSHAQTEASFQAKLPSARVVYEALSASNALLWLASDRDLYKKNGVDVSVVHGRGAMAVQALVSASAEFGAFSGPSTIAANFGGSDIVLVAARPNFVVMSIWVRQNSPIKRLEDLKGRTIGVALPGSSTHTIARLALSRVRLIEKDVQFVHHGSLPQIFLSLANDAVEAGVGSGPRPGFRELIDLSTEKIPFLQGAIQVQRSFLRSQRPTARNFLKAYVESIKIAKERPDLAVAAVVKRLKVSTEVAGAAYHSFATVWEQIPYVRTDAVQAIIDMQSKAAGNDVRPEQFIDNSVLKELEDSGFVREAYRK